MKQEIKPFPLIHPTTIVVVGTIINGLPNFTTIGDVAVAGLNPPLIMISLNEKHNAMRYIDQYHTMSVSIPTKDMLKEVDFAGIHSSKEKDKSNLFESELVEGLPLVKNAPINLILNEIDRMQVKQRIILVCEVTHTYIDSKFLQDKSLNLTTIEPILYGLDNRYYTIGEAIGQGYLEGKKLNQ
ncbi:MAG: flavin reductase family protein [Bacilli bacterium]|nr:flavin reductase family protein [Bacilli bacterium]MBN2876276.1 flavin reductase family protein [Bacilli bacterium]